MYKDIYEEVKDLEENFFQGAAYPDENVPFRTADVLKRIIHIQYGRYMNGQVDEDGDMKPWRDIVTQTLRVAARATNIDSKDFSIVPKNSPNSAVKAMILNKELDVHLEKIDIDEFTDRALQRAAAAGTVFVKEFYKEVDRKTYLAFDSVNIKNIRFDHGRIESSPIVEVHKDVTIAELMDKKGVWEDEAIKKAVEYITKQPKSKKGKKYCVDLYEVQGMLPLSYSDENAEEYVYRLQKFIVIPEAEITLYSQEIDAIEYHTWDWEERDVALGCGLIEDAFEEQAETNKIQQAQNKLLDYASLFLFTTNDPDLQGNARERFKNGEFIPSQGQVGRLDTTSPAIPLLENLKTAAAEHYRSKTSTFAAVTGEQLPANTPLGSLQIQNSEARQIYDFRRSSFGKFMRQLVLYRIIPDMKKRINKKHLLSGKYTTQQLQIIDGAVARHRTWKEVAKAIIDGKAVTNVDVQEMYNAKIALLQKGQDQRFTELESDFFDDLEYDLEIVITNEQLNKQAQMQSLTSLLQYVQDPSALQNPIYAKLLSSAVDLAGANISSSELMQYVTGVQTQSRRVSSQAGKQLVESVQNDNRPQTVTA